MWFGFGVLVSLASGGPVPAPPDGGGSLAIRLVTEGVAVPVFEVSGWDDRSLARLRALAPGAEEWKRLFAVYVAPASAVDQIPPVLGLYHVEGRALVFRPRFPLTPGLSYRAEVSPAALELSGDRVVRAFDIAAAAVEPATFVERVSPSAPVLPENLLKFYLHFSAPMGRGEAYQRIRLLDDAGRTVDAPFLELDEELWDPTGRRLTVLLDPGRIKRDLVPNREVGPPLNAGRRYSLVIDRNWRDARNRPLREDYRKIFTTGPADRRIPAVGLWRLVPPRAGTTAPLTAEFPEPLDYALLGRLLEIRDSAGNRVEGAIAIERDETRWQFRPARPWQAGVYRLRVDSALEDLAGNRINRPFEVDRFEKVERKASRQTKELRFTIPP